MDFAPPGAPPRDRRRRRPRVPRLRRRLLVTLRCRAPVPLGLLRQDGRRRLGRHRRPGAVRGRWPRHHRSGDHLSEVAASGAAMNGFERAAPDDLRAQPGGQVRQRPVEGSLPATAREGELHVAFGVTEPDAGTDTSRITTRARSPTARAATGDRPQDLDDQGTRERGRAPAVRAADAGRGWREPSDDGLRGLSLFLADLNPDYVDIRPIPKMGRNAVASCEVRVRGVARRGMAPHRQRGRGLEVPAARPQPGADPAGVRSDRHRRASIRKAVAYAKDRRVFDRPIGANQAISHPLAQAHVQLRSGVAIAAVRGVALRQRPRLR